MNTSTFLGDQETKILATSKALHDYLNYREEHDVWLHPYISELSVVGLEDTKELAPYVTYPEFRKDHNTDLSDEVLAETAADMGWLLVYPRGDKMDIAPIRYTGTVSICQRAGIAGRTIYNTKGQKNAKVMNPVRKAAILTEMLKLYGNSTALLLRDGKVSYVGSEKYGILPAKDGIKAVEAMLFEEHEEYSYIGGMVSHEFLVAEYDLNNEEQEQSLLLQMQTFGLNVSKVKAGVRFSTSDVGNAEMSLQIILSIQDSITAQIVKFPVGKAIGIRHDKGNSIGDFAKAIKNIDVLLKENEDKIEELGNTEIKYPVGAFQHIARSSKGNPFPISILKEIAEEMENEYLNGCTAMDIIYELARVVEKRNAKTPLNPSDYLNMTNAVSSAMYADFKACDKPAEEW